LRRVLTRTPALLANSGRDRSAALQSGRQTDRVPAVNVWPLAAVGPPPAPGRHVQTWQSWRVTSSSWTSA
jgi:hypothetical protein